jgi:tetratricopeptide (TPR) repeat protein
MANPYTRPGSLARAAAVAALAAMGCAAPAALGPANGLERGRAALATGAYVDARDACRTWLAAHPEDSRAELGLGAAYEGLDQLDSARAAYARVEAARPPRSVRRQMEARLRLLARRQLVEAARAAVAAEATLGAQAPRPNTVAVLPFRYLGATRSTGPWSGAWRSWW